MTYFIFCRMDPLPYEILYSIATHLDSPKDLSSFSAVSSQFNAVSRDDRLWKRFCSKLYQIQTQFENMTMSYYQ